MNSEILVLGLEKSDGLLVATCLTRMNMEPSLADWLRFKPKSRSRRPPLAAVVGGENLEPGTEAEAFSRLRRYFGAAFPIIAVGRSNKFGDFAALIDAGADDCLPPRPDPDMVCRKLLRRLADANAGSIFSEDDAPEALLTAFSAAEREGTLGDRVKVHPGAAPRLPRFRRLAPPDAGWRGVLTADLVERYSVSRPDSYLSWNRLHLFRLPDPSEYAVREKVVLRRAGPPMAAAVDRSGLPGGPDVYLVVPPEGVPAGFLCALLNSRLADFYFNRLASAEGGRLRLDAIRRFPIPDIDRRAMNDLSKIAGLLAHYGANPKSWIDRQTRDELADKAEEMVFDMYGVHPGARRELEALHF
ncbi:MAG: hypothetical protein LBJ46_11305 [Planctomycetota bacterium]|jgi:hypothetical protein|nr:hypothetical protein [Planctomycetota bacterium]